MAPSLRRLFLVEHLDLPAATGLSDAVWEPFQIRHLDDNSTFRIENKSRQIAWSWLSAAEAIADAILSQQSSLFVSINLAEAKEKIRYAKSVYENLRISGLPRLVIDSQFALEFDNGARLTSMPSRPPRGRARHNVYLDEFAHAQMAPEIYTASLPIISKGGRLRIGSTPYGPSGRFWEVYTQELQAYPGYTRAYTPWWLAQSMCTDVRTARRIAPTLTQAERVERFGKPRLTMIFQNMLPEDFAQEYECSFVSESTAWITWEELQAVEDQRLNWQHATVLGTEIGGAMSAVEWLKGQIYDRKVEMSFTAGFDVGRKRDVSEIVLVGLSTLDSYPVRLVVTMDKTPFDEQATVAKTILDNLPIAKMYIDQNGIGMQLAEQLSLYYPVKVEGVTFTAPSKAQWATEAKMLVQQRKTPLPVDRDMLQQIHSIKRKPTSVGMVFDTERNEQHHADKFWAWALGLYAGSQIRSGADVVTVVSRRRSK